MYLYGASGHAKVIKEIIESNEEKVIGFIDDNSIRLYHLCYDSHTQTIGGICLFINRQTNNIKIFGIGEDDGHMFPELNSFINYEVKGINQYELFALCSMVNDINATGLNNQIIIDKLYNFFDKS